MAANSRKKTVVRVLTEAVAQVKALKAQGMSTMEACRQASADLGIVGASGEPSSMRVRLAVERVRRGQSLTGHLEYVV